MQDKIRIDGAVIYLQRFDTTAQLLSGIFFQSLELRHRRCIMTDRHAALSMINDIAMEHDKLQLSVRDVRLCAKLLAADILLEDEIRLMGQALHFLKSFLECFFVFTDHYAFTATTIDNLQHHRVAYLFRSDSSPFFVPHLAIRGGTHSLTRKSLFHPQFVTRHHRRYIPRSGKSQSVHHFTDGRQDEIRAAAHDTVYMLLSRHADDRLGVHDIYVVPPARIVIAGEVPGPSHDEHPASGFASRTNQRQLIPSASQHHDRLTPQGLETSVLALIQEIPASIGAAGEWT